MPWLPFPSACSRLNRRERAAYQPLPWILEIFEGMCGAGRITARLAKGSWPEEARSPAADIPRPQRISQRGSAPRIRETTRAVRQDELARARPDYRNV